MRNMTTALGVIQIMKNNSKKNIIINTVMVMEAMIQMVTILVIILMKNIISGKLMLDN